MKTKLISIILSLVLTSNLFAYPTLTYPTNVFDFGNTQYSALNTTSSSIPCSVTPPSPYISGASLYYYFIGAYIMSINGQAQCYEYIVNYSSTATCPTGQVYDTSGTCTTCPSPNVVDGNTQLCTSVADYCAQNGGILKSDGTCLTANNILTSPTSTIGAGIFWDGVVFSSLGLVPTPLSLGYLATGLYAMAIGGGMYLYGSVTANNLSGSSSSPSNDVTVGDTRIKVNLDTYTGNSQVTKTDTTTNKVIEEMTVPQKVVQNLENAKPQMLTDAQTNQPLPPVDKTGTTDTKYDYTNNTATTTTVNPDQTTTTTTTPIVVTNNPDGSTTAAPSTPNSSVPVVNSGGGGQVVDKTPGTAQLGGGVQGGASLDDIYSQLHMDSAPPNGTPDNGFDAAPALMKNVEDSFAFFQLVDPLGLSAVAPPLNTISLDLYGHHFVVFDQNTLDQLPLAMIRSLFLFIAALLGLQNVLTGGI